LYTIPNITFEVKYLSKFITNSANQYFLCVQFYFAGYHFNTIWVKVMHNQRVSFEMFAHFSVLVNTQKIFTKYSLIERTDDLHSFSLKLVITNVLMILIITTFLKLEKLNQFFSYLISHKLNERSQSWRSFRIKEYNNSNISEPNGKFVGLTK